MPDLIPDWQEMEYPHCHVDYDIEPGHTKKNIPSFPIKEGTKISCVFCNRDYTAKIGENVINYFNEGTPNA